MITSGNERAIIWGDVAIHPAQVTEPDWNVMFDMDGDVARGPKWRSLTASKLKG
jgi:hypothetical protein